MSIFRRRLMTKEILKQYPQWFTDALVCWYDPKKQGLTNAQIEKGKPFILKDHSKNHIDMTMHGFDGEGMSGMNGYAINMNGCVLNNSIYGKIERSVSTATFVVDKSDILTTNSPIAFSKKLTEAKSKFKVLCKGCNWTVRTPDNKIVGYIKSSPSELDFGTEPTLCLYPDRVLKANENIIIELLPLYKGGLVFDGVDDYGKTINDKLKINDYTIITKREWIKEDHGAFVTNAIDNKFATTGYALEYYYPTSSSKWVNISKGTRNDIILNKNKVIYLTPLKYDNTSLHSGNLVSTNNVLYIGTWNDVLHHYANIVLYSFLLFNRTLTQEEIDWVKYNIMGEIPQWFNDALVCWYEPKKQGLTNNDIHKGKSFLLKDFSKNHIDMTMHGFDGEGMSSMNGYAINIKEYLKDGTGTLTMKIEDNKFTFSGKNQWGIVYRNLSDSGFNGKVDTFKIKITGLKNNEYIKYKYYNNKGIGQTFKISQNGIIQLPLSYEASIKKEYSGFIGAGNEANFDYLNVSVEILPQYEGGLVFDGVDDYGEVTNDRLKLNDYTVIAKRIYIDRQLGTLLTDANTIYLVDTSLAMEYIKKDKQIIHMSFGKYNSINIDNNSFVYCTPNKYNDKIINKGSLSTTHNVLNIGTFIHKDLHYGCSKMAFYYLLYFNRTLTQEELDYVKYVVMGEPLPKPIARWSAEGRSNEDPTGYREILPDLTGNGHNIQLHGFNWDKGSGFGIYDVTFEKFVSGGNSAYTNRNNLYVTIKNGFNFKYGYIAFTRPDKFGGDTPPEFKVRVSGLPENRYGILRYWYNVNDDPKNIQILATNGVYELRKYKYSTSSDIGFHIEDTELTDYEHWKNLKVEILPNEENVLIFDGVDDYGECNNMPIFTPDKGYTVIAKRIWLDKKEQFTAFISKRKETKTGSINFERYEDNVYSTYNFGFKNIINLQNNISFQSSKFYNNTSILKYNEQDGETLILGSNHITQNPRGPWNGAFYELHIFDHDLTPTEIELYIKKNIDKNYVLPVVEQTAEVKQLNNK